MPHIIISYRRADTDAIAGRIRDRLAYRFGDGSVFMDIDSIPFGTDFREQIKEALARNDVLIAVIGPRWLGPSKDGHFRITDETDPVRIEIETALKKGSLVIPVLVAGAEMPTSSELPDSLKDFSFRNAAEVDAGRDFHQHMERLIRSLEVIFAEKTKAPAAGSNHASEQTVTAGTLEPSSKPAPATADPLLHARATATAPKADEPALTAAVPPSTPRAAEQRLPRPSRTLWLVALFACLVAGLGSGAWLYLRGQNRSAQPSGLAEVPLQPRSEPQPPERPNATGGAAPAGCKLAVPAMLADDFKAVDPGWTLSEQTAYYVDGGLALKGFENETSSSLYWPLRFKNVVVCAIIRAPPQIGSPDSETTGGVIFWAADGANFYLAQTHPNQTYSIHRHAAGAWVQVGPRTHFDSIKPGPDAVNEIQVTTKDNLATLYINGSKVHEFRGQPPKDGSMVGLYSQSALDERNEWRVVNFAVGDPDGPQRPEATKSPAPQVGTGCKPSRTATLEDNFKSADPGWGVVSNTPASFTDGQLVLKPEVSTIWAQLYPSFFFKNATVCAHVKSPSQMANLQGTASAGLIFWAVNFSNYYTVSITPNGRFDIYRRVNGTWATLVKETNSESVKPGLSAINEIMVTFSGDMGIFYINGQKVREFRGQPPQNGGSIGLYAGSDATEVTEWRFLDVVVVEGE